MDQDDVVYIQNGILFSDQKGKLIPFTATWVELEWIMLSELSQRKKKNIRWFPL